MRGAAGRACRRRRGLRRTRREARATERGFEEYDAVYDVVRRACLLCAEVVELAKAGEGGASYKSDASPVTVADFAVQFLVQRELEALGLIRDAGDLVAEEALEEVGEHFSASAVDALVDAYSRPIGRDEKNKAAGRAASGGTWILDPIDGTRGFVSDQCDDQYVVGLALVSEEGRPVLGVMGMPNWSSSGGGGGDGTVVAAVRGCGARVLPIVNGAFAGSSAASVDSSATFESSTLLMSRSQDFDDGTLPLSR